MTAIEKMARGERDKVRKALQSLEGKVIVDEGLLRTELYCLASQSGMTRVKAQSWVDRKLAYIKGDSDEEK